MPLVAQLLSLCYNLSADRQRFKVSQKYHNFGLVALVPRMIFCVMRAVALQEKGGRLSLWNIYRIFTRCTIHSDMK